VSFDTVEKVLEKTSVFLMTNTFEIGGSEQQFCTLARGLEHSAFNVRLGCMRRFGPLRDGLGEIPEFLPVGNFFGFRAQAARLRLASHLHRNRVAVAHSFDFYSNLMLIPTARVAGVPVVIGSQRQLGDLLSHSQSAAQNVAFRLCDRVVCNSQAAADRLSAAGLREDKLAIIPNAVPDELFVHSSPALCRTNGRMRVGLIGRMNSPVKNHTIFLRAAARLAASRGAVEFVLVGDGYLRPDLQRLADGLSVSDRVVFLGERNDIPAVLAAMDISVVASSSESLSNVILESMASGVPVVATDVGGNRELVRHGETGFLVPPGSEQLLAEAIGQLLCDPALRQRFAIRAQRWTRDNFSLDRIRCQYEHLYEALLAAKGRRPDLS